MSCKLCVEADEWGILYYARWSDNVIPPQYLFPVRVHPPNWIERRIGITLEAKCQAAKKRVEDKIREHGAKTRAELDKRYAYIVFLEDHPELKEPSK